MHRTSEPRPFFVELDLSWIAIALFACAGCGDNAQQAQAPAAAPIEQAKDAASPPPAAEAAKDEAPPAPQIEAAEASAPSPSKQTPPEAARPTKPKETSWTQAELEQVSLEIQADVEELRGAKFKGVIPVKLSSKDQFVDYAVERTERMDPAEKRAADELIEKMLGLIPPDMDLMEESMRLLKDQVGGFYDPTTKTFYLMDNCPQGLAKIVLSHELGHALDDQLYDIDGTLKRFADRSDAAWAFQAVVEGSGTAVMNRWTKEHVKPLELLGMVSLQDEQTASMARSPIILWKPLLSSYLKGAAFLARTDNVMQGQMKSASNADLDQAFRFPPKSSEQILHPEKYWDSERRDEPLLVNQGLPDTLHLPADWKILRRDVMGELAIAIWSTSPAQRASVTAKEIANALGMTYTTAASDGWGGDEVMLLGMGENARALRWLTVWDSERDAAEFYGAASLVVPELKAALAKLAGGKSSLATASIRYGSERTVVIELGFGLKEKEMKPLFEAFAER